MSTSAKATPHVIWRRPDGYHGAQPEDFRVLEVGHARIWVHKGNKDSFPFKVSGSWAESDATKRLNNLVNLLDHNDDQIVAYVTDSFHQTMGDDPEKFLSQLDAWFQELSDHCKGDTWETEIMGHVLKTLRDKVSGLGKEIETQLARPK